jgi:hypothetical protein
MIEIKLFEGIVGKIVVNIEEEWLR